MRMICLYAGCGGMDLGFHEAGFEAVWSNEMNRYACDTYEAKFGEGVLRRGDIHTFIDELNDLESIDLVIGGPPCQGFSVAGKMNPDDARSNHVWTFVDAVRRCKPRAFVMENVKALAKLSKWEEVREGLLDEFSGLGYNTSFIVLNASEFGAPQKRERVFFIGFRDLQNHRIPLAELFEPHKVSTPTVRETLSVLDKAGTGNNKRICPARITLTPNPVLRKSPFAGMLFNGMGRPIDIEGYANTLPASMGGNKTPIVDEMELYEGTRGWVQGYHKHLREGGEPMEFQEAPQRLRRITVDEATLIQGFPLDYPWQGGNSQVFKQIGNSVPPPLAFAVAKGVRDVLTGDVELALKEDVATNSETLQLSLI